VSIVHGDLLFFLDDDAMLPTDDILATIAGASPRTRGSACSSRASPTPTVRRRRVAGPRGCGSVTPTQQLRHRGLGGGGGHAA
jgi:hypothetical protein